MKVLKPISKDSIAVRIAPSLYHSVLRTDQALPVELSSVALAKSAYSSLKQKIKANSLSINVSRREKTIYLSKVVASTPRRSRK